MNRVGRTTVATAVVARARVGYAQPQTGSPGSKRRGIPVLKPRKQRDHSNKWHRVLTEVVFGGCAKRQPFKPPDEEQRCAHNNSSEVAPIIVVEDRGSSR